jgi:hypothetical protein
MKEAVMAEIRTSEAVKQLLTVLRETYEGPQADWTYFIDNKPGAGALGTLEGLSAEQASRPVGTTTIASHAHHLAFSTAVAAAYVRGDRSPVDWDQSWTVKAVDAAQWTALKQRLRRDYDELVKAVESKALSSDEAFGGALGAIAHAAYHLGAIRQKAAS